MKNLQQSVEAQKEFREQYPGIKGLRDIPALFDIEESYGRPDITSFTIVMRPTKNMLEFAEAMYPGSKYLWRKISTGGHHHQADRQRTDRLADQLRPVPPGRGGLVTSGSRVNLKSLGQAKGAARPPGSPGHDLASAAVSVHSKAASLSDPDPLLSLPGLRRPLLALDLPGAGLGRGVGGRGRRSRRGGHHPLVGRGKRGL